MCKQLVVYRFYCMALFHSQTQSHVIKSFISAWYTCTCVVNNSSKICSRKVVPAFIHTLASDQGFDYLLVKQEGQVTLKRSPEFCLRLTYRYLLKADHVPGDPGAGLFWPHGHSLNKLGRGSLVDAKIWPNIKALSPMVSDKKSDQCFFPYICQC